MRKLLCLIVLLLSLGSAAAEDILKSADLAPLTQFAVEYSPKVDIGSVISSAMEGKIDLSALREAFKEASLRPFRETLGGAAGLIAPVLMLGLLGCTVRESSGARFVLRLTLFSGMMAVVLPALEAATECLLIIRRFSDTIAPALASLVTAAGMSGSAALISPAAALAGNLAEDLFLNTGLPLCRCALAVATAGNLGRAIDLERVFRFLRKLVSWGTGLIFTLFTALIALQGSVSQTADNLALRTAKYAVDSASPLIGSGVSDVWESYISGILAAKGAVGVSGVIVLLSAGLRPLLRTAFSLLMLQLIAVLLDVLGEKTAAQAAGQMGGVCRMALELCAGALAISTILLGAIMSASGGLLG